MYFGKLVLALAGMLAILSCGGSGEAASKPSPAAKSTAPVTRPVPANANTTVVYYFMTTQRCPSCMKIEAYTKEAVQRNFSDAFKKGTMVWRMVNVDTPENTHFVKEYGLYTKSVVLVKIRNGKQVEWKNLEKVWEFLGDKATFQNYVTEEVKKFVGKA